MWQTSFSILNGGWYECTPAWDVGASRYADSHRLYFPIRGMVESFPAERAGGISGGVSGGAGESSGGKAVTLEPGGVYLVPGYQAINFRCPRRMTLHWLHFRATDLEVDSALGAIHGVQSWPASAWRPWRAVYPRVAELFQHHPPTRLVAQTHAMLHYFTSELVAEELDQRRRDDPTGWSRRLAPAVRYMDEQDTAQPALARVAASVSMSPRHFHRRFVELYHMTPHAYLERRRMRRALRLLRDESLRISEIADQCGFTSPYYFSRAFSRYFGVPPTEARITHRLPEP